MSSGAAQMSGMTRIDLQRHDLSAPGREVIQTRVGISPEAPPSSTGVPAKRSSMSSRGRSSPDRRGAAEDGQGGRGRDGRRRDGPRGKNVGGGNAAVLATYVVEKGKPLITIVE